ncbi:lysR substrate binding domain protein [Sinorhizobium sp. KGO-5]|nr:lysR substrate binding domain protein [Sinorhizobium sp. KGO-5]
MLPLVGNLARPSVQVCLELRPVLELTAREVLGLTQPTRRWSFPFARARWGEQARGKKAPNTSEGAEPHIEAHLPRNCDAVLNQRLRITQQYLTGNTAKPQEDSFHPFKPAYCPIPTEIDATESLAEESRAVARGRLRISAPVTLGAHELARVLPDYLALVPNVEILLTFADRLVDLVDEGYDAVFRTRPLGDSLIARHLRPMEFAFAPPRHISHSEGRHSGRKIFMISIVLASPTVPRETVGGSAARTVKSKSKSSFVWLPTAARRS